MKFEVAEEVNLYGYRDTLTAHYGVQFLGTAEELGRAAAWLKWEMDNCRRCRVCGAMIDDEDVFWDSHIPGVPDAVETLAVGYHCPHCGHTENADEQ
jgi:hypothetical protein